MIAVGTAGFSYTDWRGPFYPAGLPENEMLGYYGKRFNAVELDYTYYRMPVARTMQSMVNRTGPGFSFCVKAYKEMTHERPESPEAEAGQFDLFISALAPLQAAGRLGCVLLQFPWAFRPGAGSEAYVARCRELLGGVEAVVEFRNAEWVAAERLDRTSAMLRGLRLGYCCVDEPRLKGLMPPIVLATSSLGYVRFHGRNAAKWWHHEVASERYDYLYSEAELGEWATKIERLAGEVEKTYVFFNNCHAGQAATNADQMLGLLKLKPPQESLF